MVMIPYSADGYEKRTREGATLVNQAGELRAPPALRHTEQSFSQAESIWLPIGDSDVRQIMDMTVFAAR